MIFWFHFNLCFLKPIRSIQTLLKIEPELKSYWNRIGKCLLTEIVMLAIIFLQKPLDFFTSFFSSFSIYNNYMSSKKFQLFFCFPHIKLWLTVIFFFVLCWFCVICSYRLWGIRGLTINYDRHENSNKRACACQNRLWDASLSKCFFITCKFCNLIHGLYLLFFRRVILVCKLIAAVVIYLNFIGTIWCCSLLILI